MLAARPWPSAARWVAAAFCATLSLSVATLVAFGTGERGVHIALFATARLMFLLFWPAYAGGALASVFGATFQPLRRHGREFGLAFASALLVHLGLVAWLCLIGGAPVFDTFVFFGIGVGWTYLIALFSIGRLQHALGSWGWWLLRVGGMNYLAYAFAVDFLAHPTQAGIRHAVAYLPFAALAIAGPALRLAAAALRVGRSWRQPSYKAG